MNTKSLVLISKIWLLYIKKGFLTGSFDSWRFLSFRRYANLSDEEFIDYTHNMFSCLLKRQNNVFQNDQIFMVCIRKIIRSSLIVHIINLICAKQSPLNLREKSQTSILHEKHKPGNCTEKFSHEHLQSRLGLWSDVDANLSESCWKSGSLFFRKILFPLICWKLLKHFRKHQPICINSFGWSFYQVSLEWEWPRKLRHRPGD